MADKSEAVAVEGLSEFRAALKAIDLNRQLSKAHKAVAAMVANKAKGQAESLGSVLAKAAPSIRPSGTQTGAAINLGGPAYPFALGAEFGGQRRPTTRQFKPWLGRTGYALYPTIRDTRAETIDLYDQELKAIFRPAFPD